ncbi:hypothetical protein ACFQJD_07310 [Haloplanus sp. GCM10025708]|uniref:hypothetical protein n=1 Tax=Haloplanus sp. GCM10025708 TaxID=3252679 RepID=UPI00361B9647
MYGPDCPELLEREYDVSVAPTLLFTLDGDVDSRFVGAPTTEGLRSEIETLRERTPPRRSDYAPESNPSRPSIHPAGSRLLSRSGVDRTPDHAPLPARDAESGVWGEHVRRRARTTDAGESIRPMPTFSLLFLLGSVCQRVTRYHYPIRRRSKT